MTETTFDDLDDFAQLLRRLSTLPVDRVQKKVEALRMDAAALRAQADEKEREAQGLLGLIAASAVYRPAPVGAEPAAVALKPSPSARRTGTTQAALRIIVSSPEKDWAVLDLLSALETEGLQPRGSDPRRALDATLHRLFTSGKIRRVAPGVYRAAYAKAAQLTADLGGESD